MKAESTIRKQARALRMFIDGDESTQLEKRFAYAMEEALLYVLRNPGEEPKNLVTSARENAAILRQGLALARNE